MSVLSLVAMGCAHGRTSRTSVASVAPPAEYLIHLPGIAGERSLDHHFMLGLREGGYSGHIEIIDWPGDDPGIHALVSRRRNEEQAEKLATHLKELLANDPSLKIRLVAHSGGTGIAAWALERLPDNAKIEMLVFLAPALSQRYDLSKALRHVRGNAYAFISENDTLVLGAGTRLFGTIDGVKEEAAGLRGFTRPAGADAAAYAKLVEVPYNADWMKYDSIGDHIGPMGETFAAQVIAPLLEDQPIRTMTLSAPPATQQQQQQQP